ncbi:hypothetical protein [Pelobacter seleniigenes]|uniref:hypothetical protein n=1 Tax=Pelobacter seleniigenes TaxID=407188 RepID=UPI0012B6D0E0|nr:hypothetical protein [Pelobacter seleniigenes]
MAALTRAWLAPFPGPSVETIRAVIIVDTALVVIVLQLLDLTTQTSFCPETALFSNLGVNLRI